MFFAAMLSITVTPFLMTLLIRRRVPPEESNPVNRLLIWLYRPVARMALKFRYGMVVVGLLAIASIAPIYARLGSEFMPPLWEESLLFMPATLPGSSIQTMKQTIQEQDKILIGFPEVESVFAKAGRANSATDPAPLEMVETVINLKPPEEWRPGMTPEKLIAEMNAAMKANMPGFSNSWTMPIKARIDMLSTGIRTPIGVKVYGPKLSEIGRILSEVEAAINTVPGTRSAFAERVSQGYYLDFDISRAAIARYGLSVMDVQDVVVAAVGGSNLTQTIEGRQRFPVNVRYGRELRDDINKLRRVLVATPTGAQIPLEELADIRFVDGPTLIKSEAAQLVGYVYVVRFHKHVIKGEQKVLVILEGRDAAGKDGTAKRIAEHLSPRESRIVALGKPSDRDEKAWYFQRYTPHLPINGEIVIFNRSWYNRAGVERVMGFCTEDEYEQFMRTVPMFEQMLVHCGFTLIKYYLDISQDEQKKRLETSSKRPFASMENHDETALEHWEAYSKARDEMLRRTHSVFAPWTVVKADDKRAARLNVIRDILSRCTYHGKGHGEYPDTNKVFLFDESLLTRGVMTP
jgi:polyphosphate kinase 2